MLTFIKRLLGLTPNPEKTAEEVKAIFIPQMTTAEPVKVRDPTILPSKYKFIVPESPGPTCEIVLLDDTFPVIRVTDVPADIPEEV